MEAIKTEAHLSEFILESIILMILLLFIEHAYLYYWFKDNKWKKWSEENDPALFSLYCTCMNMSSQIWYQSNECRSDLSFEAIVSKVMFQKQCRLILKKGWSYSKKVFESTVCKCYLYRFK